MCIWSGAQFLFQQQYYAQLYRNTQLEVTPNFYALLSTPCTSKIGINVLLQKFNEIKGPFK